MYNGGRGITAFLFLSIAFPKKKSWEELLVLENRFSNGNNGIQLLGTGNGRIAWARV